MQKISKSIVVGVSFPQLLVQRIDKDRGDVPRSRFLVRLVEHAYDLKEGASR
jgi:hypothetical protein